MLSGATVVFGADLGLCGLLPAEQLRRIQKPWLVPDTDLGGRLKSFCSRIGCSFLDLFPLLEARAAVNPRGQ